MTVKIAVFFKVAVYSWVDRYCTNISEGFSSFVSMVDSEACQSTFDRDADGWKIGNGTYTDC
jgi:hypothetical protein